jgi:transposase-like protein
MKNKDWEWKEQQTGTWAGFQRFVCPKCGRERVGRFGSAQWCKCSTKSNRMTRMKGQVEE